MLQIDPKTSVYFNLVFAAGGVGLAYIASNGFPPPVPTEFSHLAQGWAGWLGGLGAVIVAALNGALHAISSDKSGPLVAPKS